MEVKYQTPMHPNVGDGATEVWRQINNLHYSISTNGRVRNDTTDCIWMPTSMAKKQCVVGLCRKHYVVSRLVATAFLSNPENKACVRHIDGNVMNNSVSNLCWVTRSEIYHSVFETTAVKIITTQFPNDEVWKPIDGFQYSISSKGRVRNDTWGKLKQLSLSRDKRYYIIGLSLNGKRTTLPIHRLVAKAFIDNPANKLFVDHIDGDKKNNNVSNLRWASCAENNQNRNISLRSTSGVKGVGFSKKRHKWQARIRTNGKLICLGFFDTIEEAAVVRRSKAQDIFGTFTHECEK